MNLNLDIILDVFSQKSDYSLKQKDLPMFIEAKTEATWAIKSLFLELIGNDENIGVDPEWPISKVRRRDDFRTELRKKVEDL